MLEYGDSRITKELMADRLLELVDSGWTSTLLPSSQYLNFTRKDPFTYQVVAVGDNNETQWLVIESEWQLLSSPLIHSLTRRILFVVLFLILIVHSTFFFLR